MKRNLLIILLITFLLTFISVAYAAFNSELIITGDGLIKKDTIAPTCGSWYLRDSSLTIQEAYNQSKFKNPATNDAWTNENQTLFIECTDNMAGSYGCINVTEITDTNNNKRYYKDVKNYTTSIQIDSQSISVVLKDAYQNERTCTLPQGTVKPYLDKQAPEITITPTSYNKFTYSATDDIAVTGYMVTDSPLEPSIDDQNWITDPEEITIDNTAAKTYYVWSKDGVNISHETISTYLLTKTEGVGTTLSIKYNNNSGQELSTGYVLDETNIYVSATVNTGYSNLTLTKNNVNITNPSTHEINENTEIKSLADFNGVTVTFDSNGGSVFPATKTVITGQPYGELPTPTKTGYVFKGWTYLPEGYTEVEYIESSGTQWIDTGVTPSVNIKMQYKFRPLNLNSTTTVFLGSRSGSTSYGLAFKDTTELRFYEVNSTNARVTTASNYLNTSTDYYLELGNLYIKNLNTGTNVVSGTTQSSCSNPSSIKINNSDGTYAGMRTYSLKIYDGNNLIRDYVPCINESTGKAGLYDVVSKTFYGNSGSGNFTYGNVVSSSYVTSSTAVTKTTDHKLYANWEEKNFNVSITTSSNITSCTGSGTYHYGDSVTISCTKKANSTDANYTYTNGENLGSYRYKNTYTYSAPTATGLSFTLSSENTYQATITVTDDVSYTVSSQLTTSKTSCAHRENDLKSISYSNFKGCFTTGTGTGCNVNTSSWRTNGTYGSWSNYTGDGPSIPVYDNGGTGNQNAVAFKVRNISNGIALYVDSNDPNLLAYSASFSYSYTLYSTGATTSGTKTQSGRLTSAGSGINLPVAGPFLRWVSSSCPN